MKDFKYEDFRQYEKKNYAKLEFLALEEEIGPLVEKGLSPAAIYRYFAANARLTMCYQTFARYMRSKFGKKEALQSSVPAQTPPQPKQPVSKVESMTQEASKTLGTSEKTIEYDPSVQKDKKILI